MALERWDLATCANCPGCEAEMEPAESGEFVKASEAEEDISTLKALLASSERREQHQHNATLNAKLRAKKELDSLRAQLAEAKGEAELANDMCHCIRVITNANGAEDVPFLDDAVAVVLDSLRQQLAAKDALIEELESPQIRTRAAHSDEGVG